MGEVADGIRIWDLGLIIQIYDLVVSDLVLVVGFVFGFFGWANWVYYKLSLIICDYEQLISIGYKYNQFEIDDVS